MGKKKEQVYSKTWCGFYIKHGEKAANDNMKLFGMYKRQEINFDTMKKEFMRMNDIEELDTELFIDWLNSLGWKI